MAHLQLSQAFEQSYKSSETYPCNLVYQPSYLGVLKAYRDRLNNAAAKLFTANYKEVCIPFRDLLPNEQGKLSCLLVCDLETDPSSIREKKDFQ